MNCTQCKFWKRDGVDGICFGGQPNPVIIERGKECVLTWPKTNPDEFCRGFEKVELPK